MLATTYIFLSLFTSIKSCTDDAKKKKHLFITEIPSDRKYVTGLFQAVLFRYNYYGEILENNTVLIKSYLWRHAVDSTNTKYQPININFFYKPSSFQ